MWAEAMVSRILGQYRLLQPVGYGGMATVFLAEDMHLRRQVAVKVFRPLPNETNEFLRRFTREARILARLDHPHILLVHDYGEQDGLAYLVMPYLAQGSLKDLLQKRKVLLIPETLNLATQMLNALQYAHGLGLIHCDMKPGNMLFKADGTLVLSDFGLVKVMSRAIGDTSLLDTSVHADTITGTPFYIAP